MTFLRNISLFCAFITLIGCSGLRNKAKNRTETLIELTTEYGIMYIELFDETPLHKANFIKLAQEGFYDSLLFHRVMNNFMIQGGDPDSKTATSNAQLGNNGPGYTIPAHFDTTLFHRKGALAAARQPDEINPEKKSSGSQFYIAQGRVYNKEQLANMEKVLKQKNPEFFFTEEQKAVYTTVGGIPHLDGAYTVYGQVIKGLEVIDKIAAVKTNPNNNYRPISDVRMKMKVLKLTPKEKTTLLEK